MRLVAVQWQPTDRQLRQFVLILAVLLPAFGAWHQLPMPILGGLIAAGATAGLAGWFRPRWFRLLFVLVSLVTIPIGFCIGELLILVTFFAVMTPIGLCLRLVGYNPLQLKPDRQATSYWQDKTQPQDKLTYFRQS